MITLKINGEPRQMPTCWDDMIFRQYSILLNAKPETEWTELIAAWLDIDYQVFQNATLIGFEPVLAAMSFVKDPPMWGTENPKNVREFILPANITLETVIQYEHMKKLLLTDKEFKAKIADYPLAVAIYCQKARDGAYNFDKAKALAEEFQEANAREIIEAGNFFLVKLWSLNNGSAHSSQSKSPTPAKPKSSESWASSVLKRLSTMSRRHAEKGKQT